MGVRGHKGHFVFLKGLPKVEERWAARRKWRTGTHQHLSTLPLGQSLPERKAGHFRQMRAHQGQGGPSVGLGSCPCIGGTDVKRFRRSTTRMRQDICFCSQSWDHLRRRSQGWSQKCCRPHQRKTAQPSPLHIAHLVHLNGSPSWIQKHLKKTKQLGRPLWLAQGLRRHPLPARAPETGGVTCQGHQ